MIQNGVRRYGRGVRRKPGEMNKLESQYAEHLEALRIAGELLWWSFEAVKLKLAPATFYTPDFAVMTASGEIEMHESKGHWEDDARVKIKCAAEKFPFRFIAAKKAREEEWRRLGNRDVRLKKNKTA